MRPGGHLDASAVKRIKEAASSWELLWQIYNQFGRSPDGAVERDMMGAEDRLRAAINSAEFRTDDGRPQMQPMGTTMDIVKRLREGRTSGTDLRWMVTDIHREAADEIERLRAALKAIAEDGRGLQGLVEDNAKPEEYALLGNLKTAPDPSRESRRLPVPIC